MSKQTLGSFAKPFNPSFNEIIFTAHVNGFPKRIGSATAHTLTFSPSACPVPSDRQMRWVELLQNCNYMFTSFQY